MLPIVCTTGQSCNINLREALKEEKSWLIVLFIVVQGVDTSPKEVLLVAITHAFSSVPNVTKPIAIVAQVQMVVGNAQIVGAILIELLEQLTQIRRH